MVFSIGIGLTATLINPVAFSYGYDRLRFIRPVHIGDTIKTRVTITEKSDDPKRKDMGRVVERCEVINQRGEVVLAADHILLVEKKKNA
jgi:monoamine oxidase